MISDIVGLDSTPELKERIIAELNRLYRRRDFLPVRYCWRELKDIASYLRDNHGYLSGCQPEYVDSILKPFNEIEYSHIFSITKAMATKEDLKPLRAAVRADNQRLRRKIQQLKTEYSKSTGILGKIFKG